MPGLADELIVQLVVAGTVAALAYFLKPVRDWISARVSGLRSLLRMQRPLLPQAQGRMVGRKSVIEAIGSALRAGQSVALWGASGLGKSTVLVECARRLTGWRAVVMVDAQAETSPENLARKLAVATISRFQPDRSVAAIAEVSADFALELATAALADRQCLLVVDGLRSRQQMAVLERLLHLSPGALMLVGVQRNSFEDDLGFREISLPPLSIEEARKLYEQARRSLGGQISFSPELYDQVARNTLALRLVAGFRNPLHIETRGEQADEAVLFHLYGALLGSRWSDAFPLVEAFGTISCERVPTALASVLLPTAAADIDRLLSPFGVCKIDQGAIRLHRSFLQWCETRARPKRHHLANAFAALLARRLTQPNPAIESFIGGDLVNDWASSLVGLLSAADDRAALTQLWGAIVQDNYEDPRGWVRASGVVRPFAEQSGRLLELFSGSADARSGDILKNVGIFRYWVGDYDDAAQLFYAARACYQAASVAHGVVSTEFLLGYIADDNCLYRDSLHRYEKGLELAQQLTDEHANLVATGKHLVGCAIYHRGEYAASLPHFEEAAAVARQRGYQDQLARSLRRQAAARIRIGDLSNLYLADDELKEAEALSKALSRKRDLHRLQRLRGELELALLAGSGGEEGRLASAERYAVAALQGFRNSGFLRGEGYTLHLIARIRQLLGDRAAAEDNATQSLKIAQNAQSLYGQAVAERLLGEVADREDAGLAHLWRARNLFETIGHAAFAEVDAKVRDRMNQIVPLPPSIKGVIFDLMETLAETDGEAYDAALAHAVTALGVAHDAFREAWRKSRPLASTGKFADTRARLAWVAAALKRPLNEGQLRVLADQVDAVWKDKTVLYGDTRETLVALKQQGLKLGILSNGPPALAALKDPSGLTALVDVFLVSCEIGVLKPDPRAYAMLLEKLDLLPAETLFVGDGNDKELDGAAQAGLYPIRIRREAAPYADPVNQSTVWHAELSTLQELLTLMRRI